MRKSVALAVVIGWNAAASVAFADTPACGTQASPVVAVISIDTNGVPSVDPCEVYEGTEVRFVQADGADFTTEFTEPPGQGRAKKFPSQAAGHHKGAGFTARDRPANDRTKHNYPYTVTLTKSGKKLDPMLIIWPK